MSLLEIDEEICFLKSSLDAIEPLYKSINHEIKEGVKCGLDVDSSGLCDRSEFFAGLAFTICQKYISTTISWFNLGENKFNKDNSLKLGPLYTDTTTHAQIINAAANYWKHSDEWNIISFTQEDDEDMFSINTRDYSKLSPQAKKTMDILQKVTPWHDYMCANVLYELIKSDSLLLLLPILTEWRGSFLNETRRFQCSARP
ncbi:MAG: hypothetical protein ACTFAK_05520 [Candidatus Electronema sp. VV]